MDKRTQASASPQVDQTGPGRNAPCPVAVICASAGGLQALRPLLGELPADFPATLIILMHLPKDRQSQLPQVLSGFAHRTAQEITDGQALTPGLILVPPHGREPVISNGVLTLRPLQEPSYKLFDRFLTGLAEDQGDNAACVILSGLGSDGAIGAAHIARSGGVVLIQDPATATQSDMPERALAANVGDLLLPPDQLGKALCRLFRPRVNPDEPSPERLDDILALLGRQTGQDLTGYRRSTLARRVNKLMVLGGYASLEDYRAALRESPDIRLHLYRSLFIGVTSFFRDPEAFASLRDKVLRKLIAKTGDAQPLRIWVAGCSTGEEVYSLAMLLDELAEEAEQDLCFKIFASDIDELAVTAARRGVYSAKALADLSPQRQERHFLADGDSFAICPKLRGRIVFVQHNLLQDPPFVRIDLTVCRNLLIYYTKPMQDKALGLLTASLNPGGYLFLGSAETPAPENPNLETVDRKWRIFRMRDAGQERGPGRPAQPFPARSGASGCEPARTGRPRLPSEVVGDVFRRLYDPPAVLVNEDFKILHVNGDMRPYLGLGEGEPSLQVTRLARRDLRRHLAAALDRAVTERTPVLSPGLILSDPPALTLDLRVEPILNAKGRLESLLIIFERQRAVAPGQDGQGPIRPGEAALVRQYEDELYQAHETVNKVTEEYERLTYELKASNEELTSMNEELQSANEEMDASREELQSLNEELTAKVEELARTQAFLENLLRGANVPMIFLDRLSRILRFTPQAKEMFHLTLADQGRRMVEIKAKAHDNDLADIIEGVIGKSLIAEAEVVHTDGRVFLRRALPFQDAQGRTDGVVLTYADITRLKEAEALLREHNQDLESLVAERTRELEAARRESERRAAEMEAVMEQAPAAVWITRDVNAGVIIGNRTGYHILRMEPGSNVSKNDEDVTYRAMRDGRELLPEELPLQRAARGEFVSGQELELVLPDGQQRIIFGNAAPLRNFLGEVYGAVGAFMDITDLKQARAEAGRWLQIFERAEFSLAIAKAGANVIVAANPFFARERGYTPEELVGLHLFAIYPEEVRPALLESVRLADQVGHGIFESKHIRKDGSVFPVLVELTVLKDAEGRPDIRLAYCLDLTKLKRIEETLHLALKSAGAGIWEWDLETNRNVWSPETYHLYGLDPTATPASYETWRDILHPDDRDRAERIAGEAARNQSPISFEFRVLLPDGRDRWLLSQAQPQRDQHGRVSGYLGLVLDISERKRFERERDGYLEELERQNAFLEGLIQNSPVLIGVVEGPDNRYVLANPVYERLPLPPREPRSDALWPKFSRPWPIRS